ncbi:DUF3253 domain-containing protein [Actinokineospora auranticolor]|uniref:Uncharacterized protein DUF3253 n=1 Tax=Actinokineospora auranticolor TaxID=155976 RepID=A0A2S6H212_9PSEU|nr:DUF3253 domain-containing protein [Actinokineospora auranticolor]PPK71471.1 uncharacterized protein DUF3253 [Actinokineospora auranticolor]
MADRSGPRRELARIRDGGGAGADAARVALGDGAVSERLRAAILALVSGRGAASSTCPSDAARAVAEDWRDLLDEARDVARQLARSGVVRVTQRERVLDPEGEWHGPIRIRMVWTR